jgi:transposase
MARHIRAVENNPEQPPRKRGRPPGAKNKPKTTAPSSVPVATVVPFGRPTKLTPKLRDAFCALIQQGVYVERACSLLGLDKNTVYSWIEEGAKEASGPRRDFLYAYGAAQAAIEQKLSGVVLTAAETDAKVALEVLARKFPQQWGRRQLVVVEPAKPADSRTVPFGWADEDGDVRVLPSARPNDSSDPPDEAALCLLAAPASTGGAIATSSWASAR